MTLTSKFSKDLSILRAAANKEIFLDLKNPKLYKKIKRYYINEGLVELTEEDPEVDYNLIMDCIAEDPVPIIATFFPEKFCSSCGQVDVCKN